MKKYETGRSMVEIIGVLAVIGVLSIGGVMGYSYGMDKWRANEIINDVNMRMIDVAQQVFLNQSEIAIPEDWDIKGRSGYVIDVFQNTGSEPSIMVERVPSSVCKMVLRNTSDTQDIYVGVLNGDQVDGNWYMGDNEDICDRGDKEILFALDTSILNNLNPDTALECQSNADCRPDKPYCDEGVCKVCTQDSHCPTENPYCDVEKGICYRKCTTYNDCDEGYFCTDLGTTCAKAAPHMCQKLDFKEFEIDDTTYYISYNYKNWWEASDACAALGAELIPVKELMSNWTGGTGSYTKTDLLKKLYTEVATHTYVWMWTSDEYTDSCNAYAIGMNGGNIYRVNRNKNFYCIYGYNYYPLAICRKK